MSDQCEHGHRYQDCIVCPNLDALAVADIFKCPRCGQDGSCRWQCVWCLSTHDGCPWDSPMVCAHCVDGFRHALAIALFGWLP